MKSKTTAALLAFLLGPLGIHNFYLGFKGRAIAQLLITILSFGTLFWVSGLWAFVECVLILTGQISKDADGNPFDVIPPVTNPQPISQHPQQQTTLVQPLAGVDISVENIQPQQTPTSSPQTVSCPFCGEEISSKAIKCKHCQSALNGEVHTGIVQPTTGIDKSTAVEQLVLAYHQNHRATNPAIKKGIFGNSQSCVYGGSEITTVLPGVHMMKGFNPSIEKPLLVINNLLSGFITGTGLVLTNKNVYYIVTKAQTLGLGMSKISGNMDIRSIKSMVIGDSDTGLGSAYNGHDFFLNGQKIGWLRMGTGINVDDEALEYTRGLFSQLTERIFCR